MTKRSNATNCPYCSAFAVAPCSRELAPYCVHLAQHEAKRKRGSTATRGPKPKPTADPHRPNDEFCTCVKCCDARAADLARDDRKHADACSAEPKAPDACGVEGHYYWCNCAPCRATRGPKRQRQLDDYWDWKVRDDRRKRKAEKKRKKEEAKRRNPAAVGAQGPPGSKKAKKAKSTNVVRPGWWTRGAEHAQTEVRPVPRRAPTAKERRELEAMHSYCRAHDSKAELQFIARFIMPVAQSLETHGVDSMGNIWGTIYPPDGSAVLRTMFSAHTDDVSTHGGRRSLRIDGHEMSLRSTEGVDCLGADNAAGCWLLMELARARVPGMYVWHRKEESGLVGSKYFARRNKGAITAAGVRHVVAFDRRRYGSIISHQRRQRCASETFVHALANALEMGHVADPGGSFTDSASYMDFIPECTNVSAGFTNEHSTFERLDLGYLCRLRDAVVQVPWQNLPAERDPQASARPYAPGAPQPYVPQPTWPGRLSDAECIAQARGGSTHAQALCAVRGLAWEPRSLEGPPELRVAEQLDSDDAWHNAPRTMKQLIEDYPEELADLLEHWGYTAESLHKDILEIIWGEATSH